GRRSSASEVNGAQHFTAAICIRRMENSFHSIRKQYIRGSLDESLVNPDPLVQLHEWVSEAIRAECPEPTAMVLSTSGKNLKPSSRVVLMKGLDQDGLTFFTNYESRKGQQLADNPQAALLFFWPDLERQVRVEGFVTRIPEAESDAYFASRPEASRISAVISPQSCEIPNRKWLEDKRQFAVGNRQETDVETDCNLSPHAVPQLPNVETDCNLPLHALPPSPAVRPSNWGGYRFTPDYFEFWLGRVDRLHDRIIYRRSENAWKIARLAP
ncbi:MAG: pyridoxal 5'-phosphate synthase, partial [Bacteroidales bacterium]